MTQETWQALLTGMALFTAGLLTALGRILSTSKKKEQERKSEETMEIAGAIIDSKAANALMDTFQKNSANSAALQLELAEVRKSVDRLSDSLDDAKEEARRLRETIKDQTNALLYGKHS